MEYGCSLVVFTPILAAGGLLAGHVYAILWTAFDILGLCDKSTTARNYWMGTGLFLTTWPLWPYLTGRDRLFGDAVVEFGMAAAVAASWIYYWRSMPPIRRRVQVDPEITHDGTLRIMGKMVVRHNGLGIASADLNTRVNTKGAGRIVYARYRTTPLDGDEIAIWLVLGKEVYALNNAAKIVTPKAKLPRDAPSDQWGPTNVNASLSTAELLTFLGMPK